MNYPGQDSDEYASAAVGLGEEPDDLIAHIVRQRYGVICVGSGRTLVVSPKMPEPRPGVGWIDTTMPCFQSSKGLRRGIVAMLEELRGDIDRGILISKAKTGSKEARAALQRMEDDNPMAKTE